MVQRLHSIEETMAVKMPISDARGIGGIGKPGILGAGGGKKPHTPNPISAAAKLEHAIVGQTLIDIIGPRLNHQVCPQEHYERFTILIFPS